MSDSPVSRRYVYFQSSSSSDNGYWDNTASGNYRYILEFDNNVAASSDVNLVLSTDGTATICSTEDYSLSASTLTISAGSSSTSITINEGATDNSDNDADEPTETIIITAALD